MNEKKTRTQMWIATRAHTHTKNDANEKKLCKPITVCTEAMDVFNVLPVMKTTNVAAPMYVAYEHTQSLIHRLHEIKII